MNSKAGLKIGASVATIGLLVILFSSGCVTPRAVHIEYTPSQGQTAIQPPGIKLAVRVKDERAFKIERNSSSILVKVTDDIRQKFFLEIRRALEMSGYEIAEEAPVVVEVTLKEFYVRTIGGGLFHDFSEDAVAKLEINVWNSNHVFLNKEAIGTAQESWGRGSRDFFEKKSERVLNSAFSSAIDYAINNQNFAVAVREASSAGNPVTPTIQAPITTELSVEQKFLKPVVWLPMGHRQVWVLAVGVGQYRSQTVPELPNAKADAERVRDWFLRTDGVCLPASNIHLLCDEQATRENLLEQIDWLRRQAMPEDAVFIYFAGHGAPELAADGSSVNAKYLVLHDTNPQRLFATGFALDDLTRKLDAVDARVQVVILEACYTGPVGQEILKKTPTADLEIRPRLIQEMGERKGRLILSASSGRQMAIGSDELKGMLFTHYLLDAWGNGNKKLVGDCFEQVRENVRRAAKHLGSTQEPMEFGDQNMDILLKP